MAKFYHVTPLECVRNILIDGLEPRVGDRSHQLGESSPAIHLFPSTAHVEDALGNWLGDAFDEDVPLAVLEIEINLTPPSDHFEIAVLETIPPSAIIDILDENLKAFGNGILLQAFFEPETASPAFQTPTNSM